MLKKIYLWLFTILALLVVIGILWQKLRECQRSCPPGQTHIKSPKKDSVLFTNSKCIMFSIIHKTQLAFWTRPDTTSHFTLLDSFPLSTGAGIYFQYVGNQKYLYVNDPLIPGDGSYKIMGMDMGLLSGYGTSSDVGLIGPISSGGTSFSTAEISRFPGAFTFHGGFPYLRVRGMGSGSSTTGYIDDTAPFLQTISMDGPVGVDYAHALILQTDAIYNKLLLIGYPVSIPNNPNQPLPFYYLQPYTPAN
jgi:hypothetical protein